MYRRGIHQALHGKIEDPSCLTPGHGTLVHLRIESQAQHQRPGIEHSKQATSDTVPLLYSSNPTELYVWCGGSRTVYMPPLIQYSTTDAVFDRDSRGRQAATKIGAVIHLD